MGRYKNNPYYDPDALSQKLMEAVVHDYNNPPSEDAVPFAGKMKITALARKHKISVLKVRKLLVTAGALKTEQSVLVQKLHSEGKTLDEIANTVGCSRATANSWLPYSRIIYNMEEISPNAIRLKRFKQRKRENRM